MKQKKTVILIALLVILFLVMLSMKTIFEVKPTKEEIIFEVEDKTKEVEKLNSELESDIPFEYLGWVRVQGTNIDNSVIGFKGIRPSADIEPESRNYAWQPDYHNKLVNKETLVGHNILNLSTNPEINTEYFSGFEDLMAFVYYDFAKNNKYIQYTIGGKNYVYKIFSVYFEETYIAIGQEYKDNVDKKTLKKIIKRYKDKSFYKYNIDVDENDKIISLDTCTRFYGENDHYNFVVNARLLRDDEKIDDYMVTKTNNYKKIEKIIEKGENDSNEA